MRKVSSHGSCDTWRHEHLGQRNQHQLQAFGGVCHVFQPFRTQKDALHHFNQTDPRFEVSNLSKMFSAI